MCLRYYHRFDIQIHVWSIVILFQYGLHTDPLHSGSQFVEIASTIPAQQHTLHYSRAAIFLQVRSAGHLLVGCDGGLGDTVESHARALNCCNRLNNTALNPAVLVFELFSSFIFLMCSVIHIFCLQTGWPCPNP